MPPRDPRSARRACGLALALWLTLGAFGPVAAARSSGHPTRMLADFESTGRWRGVDGSPGSRIWVQAVPDPSGMRPGRSLHVRFVLGDAPRAATGVRVSFDPVDASDFDHLALWIRGDERSGFGPALKIQLHRLDPDSGGLLETGSFVVEDIGPDWQHVVVPLGRLSGLSEWRDLGDFVVVVQARRVGVASGAYYLDDVELIATGDAGPRATDRLRPPGKRAFEREADSPEELARRLHARLTGWPERSAVPASELPGDPDAFLWRLAGDTWRGLEALTDRASGLPIDNVRFVNGSLAAETARIGDFTNVTNVGLHLMAISAARDLGLLPRDEALARLERLLGTLERLETHAGFFFNYYDTTTLERSSHFVSFVDSAWLTAGLLVARNAFPELAARATRLVERGDYGFFYDPVEQLMSHGYWVNLGVPAEYHYGLLFTEARLGSLVAIGKGDVPAEHWTCLQEGFAALSEVRGIALGVRVRPRHTGGGRAGRWQGVSYSPSWGGSMFEALMPVLVLDEPRLARETLGRNDEAHAVIQRRYALEKLGLPVWGFSPSAEPGSDRYEEYGLPLLGLSGYPPEIVAPYASALALAVTPGPAIENLRRLAQMDGVYGDFGLYDSVDPKTGAVAHKYLALDQSMLFLALANHLGDGCVRRRFAADEIVRRALPLLVTAAPPAD